MRLVDGHAVQVELAPAPTSGRGAACVSDVGAEAAAQERLLALRTPARCPTLCGAGSLPYFDACERVALVGERAARDRRRARRARRRPGCVGGSRLHVGERLREIDVAVGVLGRGELARFGDCRGAAPVPRAAASRAAASRSGRRAAASEQILQVGELRHARSSRALRGYASASSAAMQPVPAEVTAWR